jgi:protoheme IX farnesyltransferase
VASLGIWLVAAAAAAFNCLVEKSIDVHMKRTAWRPTARGRAVGHAGAVFSAGLCILGSAILLVWSTR